MGFDLAVCAEMLWPDRPIEWRVARLHEMGLAVGLWNWPAHDIDRLAATGARFGIMNGPLAGALGDPAGAEAMLASAAATIPVARRLGVARLNVTGAALGPGGRPVAAQAPPFPAAMWAQARDTLHRLCDLAEAEDVVFALENLNPLDHPGVPFSATADVLALVRAVDRPQLRINLDLYHTQIGEGDLIRWVDRCLPWVGEIQVADNPGRFEPGTGEIHYPAVARALRDRGYAGAVTLESHAKTTPEAAIAAFRAAFAA